LQQHFLAMPLAGKYLALLPLGAIRMDAAVPGPEDKEGDMADSIEEIWYAWERPGKGKRRPLYFLQSGSKFLGT
jgi:hypothetical protein